MIITTAKPRKGNAMKLIIAGGRNLEAKREYFEMLDGLRLAIKPDVTEVVCGLATGADAMGEWWAKLRGIPVKSFQADWKTHGKAAGPIRNRQMAEYADIVVLFPGGRGTNSMFAEAKKAGIQIYDWRRCAG